MSVVDVRVSSEVRTPPDWRQCDLGGVGDFGKRVVIRRMGSARQFVIEWRITDAVSGNLVAASIQTEPAGP